METALYTMAVSPFLNTGRHRLCLCYNKHIATRSSMQLIKFVPIAELDATRKRLREQGIKFRIYFRGPRYGRFSQDTLKEDAVGFTVYEANK